MSNFGEQFRDIVAKVAPTVGVVLGGPLGGLAGNVIANALGPKNADGTPDTKAIEKMVLAQDPETMLKLTQAENDLIAKLKEMDINLEQISANDRASARSREMALHDWTPSVLAGAVTVGFFGVLGYLLGYGKPAVGGDALLVMLGSLGTAWTAIISYYFGSSAGSAKKDATISAIVK